MWPRAIAEAELLMLSSGERWEVRQRIYSCLRKIVGLGLSTPNIVLAGLGTRKRAFLSRITYWVRRY
jgi:hypothetical protein